MSGSSHAQHDYTRCTVSLDAGISISWAPDPDGSYAHGQQHHQREEAAFRARLMSATAMVEVLLDEVESAGHVFTLPTDPAFKDAQRASSQGFPICELRIMCEPALSRAKLDALLARISAELEPPPPAPPAPEPEPAPAAVAPKPWWKRW